MVFEIYLKLIIALVVMFDAVFHDLLGEAAHENDRRLQTSYQWRSG